jgi:hypothetical protein
MHFERVKQKHQNYPLCTVSLEWMCRPAVSNQNHTDALICNLHHTHKARTGTQICSKPAVSPSSFLCFTSYASSSLLCSSLSSRLLHDESATIANPACCIPVLRPQPPWIRPRQRGQRWKPLLLTSPSRPRSFSPFMTTMLARHHPVLHA